MAPGKRTHRAAWVVLLPILLLIAAALACNLSTGDEDDREATRTQVAAAQLPSVVIQAPGDGAQVLVGQEQEVARPAEPPAEEALGVGRGAHGAAVLADERLDGRRRVLVGDGRHVVAPHGREGAIGLGGVNKGDAVVNGQVAGHSSRNIDFNLSSRINLPLSNTHINPTSA